MRGELRRGHVRGKIFRRPEEAVQKEEEEIPIDLVKKLKTLRNQNPRKATLGEKLIQLSAMDHEEKFYIN